MAKVQSIKAYEVVVPAREGAVDSAEMGQFLDGTPWPMMPICLLEFGMDDGITALGEVGRGVSLKMLEESLGRAVGMEFSGISTAGAPAGLRSGAMWGLVQAHPPALWQAASPLLPAIEMATLDWAGKRLGCRAVDLLGGAYAESVPVDYWSGRKTPKDLAKTVEVARERGFTGIKMKSRIGDPAAEQVRAIRDAAGAGFRVTIDPMFQWLSPHEAAGTFRSLEPYADGLRIEDPFPQDVPDFWRRIRQVSPIPLIWHARTLDVMRRAVQEGCCDAFNCSGAVQEFLTLAHAAEVLGYTCWHGSGIEMGVAQACHIHAAAAARSCVLHGDFVSGFVREHTLVTWDWPYKMGRLPIPPGAGLGVELDRAAVKRYQTAAAEFGAR